MRSLCVFLLFVVGCSKKMTANEENFVSSAAEDGCSVLYPCTFSVNAQISSIRYHADLRQTSMGFAIESFKSVGVDSDSLLLVEGARMGCGTTITCEFTMLQDPPHDVLLMINELDREDNSTVFRLSDWRITVEK